jgi:hypothetical protein
LADGICSTTNCYEAAKTAGVLEADLLEKIRPDLEAIKPWPAVFDRST